MDLKSSGAVALSVEELTWRRKEGKEVGGEGGWGEGGGVEEGKEGREGEGEVDLGERGR